MERGKKRGAALLLAGLMTCSAALLSACGSGENKEAADKPAASAAPAEESTFAETQAPAEESSPAEELTGSRTLFRQGLLAVCSGDKWGYVDESGHYVINP